MFDQEVRGIEFSDKRLVDRLFKIGDNLLTKPSSLVTTMFCNKGNREATYRFLSNPKVVTKTMLESHQTVVCDRIVGTKSPVILIQDSTYLNYDKHPCTKNLGRIGAKRDNTNGLILHSSIAIDVEKEVCLGVFDQMSFYHVNNQETDKKKLSARDIEQKESYRWVKFLKNAINKVPKAITICDRESDIFEFLHLASSKGGKIIVRQSQDHIIKNKIIKAENECKIECKSGGISIEKYFANQEVKGTYQIKVEEEEYNGLEKLDKKESS